MSNSTRLPLISASLLALGVLSRMLAVIALAGISPFSFAAGEKTYDLKGRSSVRAGETRTFTMTHDTKMKLIDPTKGQDLYADIPPFPRIRATWIEECLEADMDERCTRAIAYLREWIRESGSRKDTTIQDVVLEGRDLGTNPAWKFLGEPPKPSRAARQWIEKRYSTRANVSDPISLLPKKPVAIGESWDVDEAAIRAYLSTDFGFNKIKASGKGVLIGVENDVAHFRVTFSTPISEWSGPAGEFSVAFGKKGVFTFDADVFFNLEDRTGSMTVRLHLNGDSPVTALKDSSTGKVAVDVTVKFTSAKGGDIPSNVRTRANEGTRPAPRQATEKRRATRIAAGPASACAVSEVGTVYCWGGIVRESGLSSEPKPVKIQNLPPVRSVSVHVATSCAVDLQNRVWCWGFDFQKSIKTNSESVFSQAILVEGLPPVKDVSVGWLHACVISLEGAVWCWGFNAAGELGTGDKKESSRPIQVGDLSEVTSIGTGVNNTCAITTGNNVKCWGTDNQRGKSGQAFIFQAMKPVDIPFNPLAKKVVNGRNFACGLHMLGAVTCWGSNIFHQLGVSEVDLKSNRGVATVQGVRGATDVAASMFSACASDIDGEVTCWGMWAMEELSPGGDLASIRKKNFTQLPTVVEGLRDVEQVAVGSSFACALVWGGSIKCWGKNNVGQLGNGTLANSPAPVDILDFPPDSIN